MLTPSRARRVFVPRVEIAGSRPFQSCSLLLYEFDVARQDDATHEAIAVMVEQCTGVNNLTGERIHDVRPETTISKSE